MAEHRDSHQASPVRAVVARPVVVSMAEPGPTDIDHRQCGRTWR